MPRKAATCAGFKLSPTEWCDACKNKKGGCMRRGEGRPGDGTTSFNTGVASSVASDSSHPAGCSTDAASGSNASGAIDAHNARAIKQPERFAPAEFWQRPLPNVAKAKGTQLSRTAELAHERELRRDDELQQAFAAGLDEGSQQAETAVKEIRARMDTMFSDLQSERQHQLAKLKAEQRTAEAAKRTAEAAKRQKTLEAFFNAPPPAPGVKTRARGEPEQLGSGYTQRNVTSGCFAQHVKAIEDHIINVSQGDSLKQLQLATAISQRMNGIRQLRDRDMEAWGYIRNSLKAFFEKIHDRHLGRFPQHMRAAQQAVCAAIANAVPPRKLHVLAAEFDVTIERLAEGRKHWSEWLSGDRESLADLQAKMRSDKMDEAWVAHAVDVWTTHTRRSERAKDSLRNPNDKADKKLYRVHWLEVRMSDILEIIVTEGKRKFNMPAVEAVEATETSAAIPAKPAVAFHFSWWYLTKTKPFFVKPAGREVCVCVYHLRFDLFVEALYNYTKRLRTDMKVCSCQHANVKSPIDFRRANVCKRTESERFDNVPCVNNTCSSCSDLKLFTVCECTPKEQLPKIKCQLWEKIEYECKDGTIKTKSDFRPREISYADFDTFLRKYWPKFQLHHDVGKWQDDECAYLKTHIDCGEVFEIEDFGENYHIQRTREHQAYYFSEVGVTLHGNMIRVRVEDLSDEYLGPGTPPHTSRSPPAPALSRAHCKPIRPRPIPHNKSSSQCANAASTGEKAKLLAFFATLKKTPIVLIAHITISEDLTHDNGFVQHVNGKVIWEWLLTVLAPGVILKLRTICSDGAPNQYKLAEQILWLSKQGADIDEFITAATAARAAPPTAAPTATPAATATPSVTQQPTPKTRHVFRGTAHGKDDSDPELGHHKNAADRYQLRAGDGSGEVARIFTPRDFYNFASTQMRLLQKDFYLRKGVGIYRREFHWVPNHGTDSINRRIAGCNRLGDVGIKKLHFFESIGRPGCVGIRERSCHKCLGACAIGKFEGCQHTERCGHYRVLELSPKTAIPRPVTRQHEVRGALAFAETAKEGVFFAVGKRPFSTDKFTMFSIAKDNVFRMAEEAIAADEAGHLEVKADDEVVDAVRYSCVSPGGTVFTPTKIEVVVPVAAIVAYDLDITRLEVLREARTFVPKWRL